ncbi:MAG: inositol 2-dehydrogenase [Aeoliella sp.]
MTSDKLNIGLIGAGRIGRLHAEHLSHRIAKANLVMVADVSHDAASQCAQHTGTARATTNVRDILDHPDIQAVVICSSTDTHAQIIKEAAEAGKHIFCEKPIDQDLEKIDEAIAAVRQAGVLLQIGFNRRFDANFQRIRDAVAHQEIGEPHLLHIISRDPAPPPIGFVETSGGLFMDLTIHDFDLARFLIGHEVEEIYATGGVRVDPAIGDAGDLDTAMILLKFTNGVIGNIDNSRQAVYGYDQRVEVFGSGGSIQAGNNFPNSVMVWGKNSVYRDRPHNFFLDRYVDSYLNEMMQFVDAVLDDKPSPMDGNEGRCPVVMALAARMSYDENRPVRLDEVDRSRPPAEV